MSTEIHRFVHDLLSSLMLMEQESVPHPSGQTTGLNYYGLYRNPDQVKPQTEPCWTKRLNELFLERGYQSQAEVQYPVAPAAGRRWMCDNVVTLADGTRVWLENKGAWKDYWSELGNVGKFLTYLNGDDKSASHDLQKLASLPKADADYVALLLVGFDLASDSMEEQVRAFALDRKLVTEWQEASIHWSDRWRPGHRVHAWVWWKETASKSTAAPVHS
jgi:hypothetical protein